MPTMPPIHRPAGWRPPEKARNPDHAFYGTSKWKRLRAIVRKRDGGICSGCGAPNSWRVDHRVARSEGGADHESNLRLFCTTCDNRRHPEKGRVWR